MPITRKMRAFLEYLDYVDSNNSSELTIQSYVDLR